MKNMLTGRIDHLNFKNRETIRSTRIICATCSTVAKLYIYINTHTCFEAHERTLSLCHPKPSLLIDSTTTPFKIVVLIVLYKKYQLVILVI
jgi:hypothetical protein